ncbi:MAG: hypothetical protein ACI9T9_000210 [Oleiphilaceae bacterium]|jgi:uncharacterized protein YacL (UPF0231 family)
MDYEYTIDEYGQLNAQFSIGYEALGLWFNEEIESNSVTITDLLDRIDQLEQRKKSAFHIEGKEFQLRLNQDGVEVVAWALGFDVDEALPENTNLYDQESFSECGLQDFKQAVLMWQEFVLTHKR